MNESARDTSSASPAPSISVVIPVLNERASIRPLIDETGRALGGQSPFEVIVVDDGSDDGTDSLVRELARTVEFDLRCLRHDRRRGQSAALITGIRAARGEWVATIDGDGQNDPADIARLWPVVRAAWEADRRVVGLAGIREQRKDPLVRLVTSRLANRVRSRLLKDGVPDSACGLKIFRRDAALALPTFDHMHRFLPALFQINGGLMMTAPVNHRPRETGASKYGIRDRLWVGIVDLFGVRWLKNRALGPRDLDRT